MPLLAGLQVAGTGGSAASLAVALYCRRPPRWVPGLRSIIGIGAFLACLVSVPGLLGVTGTQDSPGTHGNVYASVSFAPATVMCAGVLVLLSVSHRRSAVFRKTLRQDYWHHKALAAQLGARQAGEGAAPGTGVGGAEGA